MAGGTSTLSRLFVCLTGIVVVAAPASWARTIRASDRGVASAPIDDHLGADDLVRQLGSAGFRERERASVQLARLGLRAMESLERGLQSDDREVRFRCRRLLTTVRAIDFERRLQAFSVGRDGAESYSLPAWGLFCKLVGQPPGARSLFVEMQRAEPEILRALDRTPQQISNAVMQRLLEIQENAQRRQRSVRMSLGTVATVLFVLDCQVSHITSESRPLTASEVSSCFRQTSFASAIVGGTHRALLRDLFGRWIERTKGLDAYYAMLLGLQYDVPQSIVPASRFLKNKVAAPNQPYFRYNALLVVARFGDASHVQLAEPYLDDKTPYGGSLATSGKVKYRPQIRDVALATVIQLVKQDHEKFGFTRLTRSSTSVFNTSSLAFEDDTHREAAIKKWRAYWARRQDKEETSRRSPVADPAGS